jgi:hypothetical protein
LGDSLASYVVEANTQMVGNVALASELIAIGFIDAAKTGVRRGFSVVVENNLTDVGSGGVKDLPRKFILKRSTCAATVYCNDEAFKPGATGFFR